MGLLVGTGPRRRDSQHLWELDWLRVPSTASASFVGSPASTSCTSSFAQWHHRLGHLCGSSHSSVRLGDPRAWSGDKVEQLRSIVASTNCRVHQQNLPI